MGEVKSTNKLKQRNNKLTGKGILKIDFNMQLEAVV